MTHAKWPTNFPGKHESGQQKTQDANDIASQTELNEFCFQKLQKRAKEIVNEFGIHMVDEYLKDDVQKMLLQYSDVDSPVARKRLDIQTAIDEVMERLK